MANCIYVPDLLYIIEVWIHILLGKSTEMQSKNLLLVVITNYEHFSFGILSVHHTSQIFKFMTWFPLRLVKLLVNEGAMHSETSKYQWIFTTIACNRNTEKSRFLQNKFKLPVTLQITSVTGYCFIICKIKTLLFTLPHASKYSLLKHATSLFCESFHLKRNYSILVCLNRKNAAGRIKQRTQF